MLECNKSSALQQVDFWDRVESKRSLTVAETELKKEAKESYKKWVLLEEVHWRQLSREIWLREGDRNTGFFHRMASAHRRNNALDRVKVNGEWLSEEQEVRERIVNTFQQMISEDMEWKADIGRLQIDHISQQEAENLEDFTKKEILDMFKEFHEHNSFVKSLNNTFLVLIPKKSGVEDLGDFRPISLLGGLYKLLAKVLANRLKKVIGKVVSTAQNAFVTGRQIFDASLIANEVANSWQKRKEKGLICKLDIEKAYDSINWKFLMKVSQKIGFGAKWLGWMWSCLSSAKFLVLVNGVPTGELWRGDTYQDASFGGGSRPTLNISHLFFANDTTVFCEASKEQLTHLSWILLWFEAASSLRINLAKSEIIPVGEVEEIQELAVELGCRVGSLTSQYLGLPLGAPNRAPSMWDGVEERTVAKRTEKVQRDFLWGGGNLEGKIYLVKWDVVCTDKNKGGLGLRKIAMLNRALLGKWIWRFTCEKDNLWKQVITTKYGQEDRGWRSKKVNGAVGVGVWNEILKESDWCWDNLVFLAGKGTKIRFRKDIWCTDTPLSHCFTHLFVMATHRDAKLRRCGIKILVKEAGI
ncbi:Transposon TX1 uncharacterized 149 kDa protein [Vitis vinifera]|uniref:Transposon TX1 uncharacterized 149 kDa protein n=1 Tax=Vitis vinifera TaxID=29760 RepID=A0A438DFT4_VITVI|nr:Transposon TX1 uncharacterized 149 kDa protein [Vitis vinifera]